MKDKCVVYTWHVESKEIKINHWLWWLVSWCTTYFVSMTLDHHPFTLQQLLPERPGGVITNPGVRNVLFYKKGNFYYLLVTRLAVHHIWFRRKNKVIFPPVLFAPNLPAKDLWQWTKQSLCKTCWGLNTWFLTMKPPTAVLQLSFKSACCVMIRRNYNTRFECAHESRHAIFTHTYCF